MTQQHEHRYQGQTLRHSHEDIGPHGYYEHPEDFPPTPGSGPEWHQRAVAEQCSHGGHGWEGETCGDADEGEPEDECDGYDRDSGPVCKLDECDCERLRFACVCGAAFEDREGLDYHIGEDCEATGLGQRESHDLQTCSHYHSPAGGGEGSKR